MNRASRFLFSILLFFLSVGLFTSSVSFAKELISVDKALKKIFPAAAEFDKRTMTLSAIQVRKIEEQGGLTFAGAHADTLVVYIAKKEGEIVGYAFEDIVLGKWGPIHYLVGVDRNAAVREVVVLGYEEIRGRPVAKRRFLRQYEGKTKSDPLQLRRDIDGITGATISSRSMTEGVRKILFIFEELFKS